MKQLLLLLLTKMARHKNVWGWWIYGFILPGPSITTTIQVQGPDMGGIWSSRAKQWQVWKPAPGVYIFAYSFTLILMFYTQGPLPWSCKNESIPLMNYLCNVKRYTKLCLINCVLILCHALKIFTKKSCCFWQVEKLLEN